MFKRRLEEMERAQGELKRKNSELSDMIDPGT
jgi:hypothetical protein